MIILILDTLKSTMDDRVPFSDQLQSSAVKVLDTLQQQLKSESTSKPIDESEGQLISNAQGAVAAVRSASETVDDELGDIDGKLSEESSDMESVVEEITSLTSTIEEISQNANEVANRSERTADNAEEGLEAAKEALSVMDKVSETGNQLADNIQGLEERLERIEDALSGIADIAEKTNMLALNARIEAANSESESKGFAVVANEIKNLADQSRQQADEVETILADVREATDSTKKSLYETVEQVDNGSTKVQETMQKLDDVANKVERTADDVATVSEATDQQAETSESVKGHCERAAHRVNELNQDLDTIRDARAEQTKMLKEIENTLSTISTTDSGSRQRLQSNNERLDSVSGGLILGGTGVLLYDGEMDSVANEIADLTSSAIASGLSVSITPPPELSNAVLARSLNRFSNSMTIRELLSEDRLFVLDAFNSWRNDRNVFDLSKSSLQEANERTQQRRDNKLLVIGNIRGEIEVLGQKEARQTRYSNDEGFLNPDDSVLNVIDTSWVDDQFASFYTGAADQIIEFNDSSVPIEAQSKNAS